ncbi:MAG TPA: hypothetical protein VLF18_18095 [Tahibacter sp.]|uniref:hypothetical protein n=1 Tax=Tahibacter sp. TaxID=2056211 RepID=UPI002C937B47|nr:hypothetical protein [Tahibacter sp.]HSX62099.1 hypothetical protein [Tahibacter sp.]
MKEPTTYIKPNSGSVTSSGADKAAENPIGRPAVVEADSERVDEKAVRTTASPQPVAGENDGSKR